MNYYNSETLLEQQQEIEKLKEQNAALAAQVEAFRSAMLNACNVTDLSASKEQAQAVYRMGSVLQATPQHHLTEVRAEAIKQALDSIGAPCAKFQNKSADFTAGFNFCGAQVQLHADSIRKGEVK